MKKMLKQLITSILFTISVGSMAQQDSIPKFGFGRIYLGMTIESIPELSSFKTINNMSDYLSKVYKKNSGNKSYELFADTTELNPSFGSLDGRVREFYITNMSITDNIEIEEVELKFFNNILFSIQCDYASNIIEALTHKFGEPKSDLKETKHEFTYTYTGNTVTKTDQEFTSTWDLNNPNIHCSSLLYKYYSSKGEERIIDYITFRNSEFSNDIELAVKSCQDRISKRREEKKKESFSKF